MATILSMSDPGQCAHVAARHSPPIPSQRSTMRVSSCFQQRVRWRIGLVLTVVLAFMLPGCMTESARQTATSEAGGTPVITNTPAGNILMIDDEVVVEIFVPDPQQAALYALTEERLYSWQNRQWHPTPTLNDGRKF